MPSKAKARLLVLVGYDCDDMHLDSTNCSVPKFDFYRLDPPNMFSPGFNFRYSTRRVRYDGTESRSVTKVLGLRVLFTITGKGGRFSIVALSLSLGSGLALLGISTLICDFILQYFLPGREKLIEQKYFQDTNDAEAINRQTTESVGFRQLSG